APVYRQRVDERIWRRLDFAAGNWAGHRDLVRLDRIRAALGRQSSRQPKPLRRADLRSIRTHRLAHRLWRDSLRTLFDRAADAERLQRPRLFGPGPETEALVYRRMDILW